jgi:hypothetical protein
MVLGGVSSLEVERVDILGILATVAVVIDISEHTTLETIVGIVGYRWQDTKVPTCFDFTAEGIHLLRLRLTLGVASE